MIRVGFLLNMKGGWLGGSNYFVSLLSAVRSLDSRRTDPVLIVGEKYDSCTFTEEIPGLEIIRTAMLDRLSPAWIARNVVSLATRREPEMESLLRESGISVLSHASICWDKSAVPIIAWVPDLQHKYLQRFFSMSEMKKRDGWIRRLCEKSAVIIVSSAEAARDMARFFPESAGRVRVLHFVARDAGACKISDVRSVKSRYGITGQYFIVANQFWAHKNHRLIIDALKRFSGPPGFIVVATGSALDYRDSGYFARLMDYAASSGVSDFLKVTGVVPYEDLRVLIEGSMALINPSRFEGWSTPLEEAKASGKKSLLSDIPVHREQCPERAVFFAPDDAEGLAACMRETALEFDEREERKSRELAYQGWLSARRVFAEQFEDIVLEAASANKSCPYGDHRR